jgi:hypothetical protein
MTQLCAADCHRPVVAGRSTGHPIWRKFAKQKTEDKSFLFGEAPSGGGWIHLVSAARRGVCSRIDIRKRRVVVVGGQRIDPQPARTKSTVQVDQTASGSRRRHETASCLFSSKKKKTRNISVCTSVCVGCCLTCCRRCCSLFPLGHQGALIQTSHVTGATIAHFAAGPSGWHWQISRQPIDKTLIEGEPVT